MRILYFSEGYSLHDHRFLAALAETSHAVFYLRLEDNARQIEDRPVPSKIEQILWAGGRSAFRWRDVPRLVLDLRRVIKEIKPDLIHAGPIQTCAFLVALSGFRPLLSMSWGFDLMQDAERNAWWRWLTRYTLRHSTYFTSDAQVTRRKAVEYGMDPERTVVFPWGVDLKHFSPQRLAISKKTLATENRKSKTLAPRSPAWRLGATQAGREPVGARRPGAHLPRAQVPGSAGVINRKSFTLFCNRAWEPRYGVDVLAKAFVKVAQQRKDVSLLLLAGGSQAQTIRQILMNGGVMERVQFGGQVSQTDLPRWYHIADLFISPSHVDGSSVSLMEALACGLPALVSDIPANQEWVREGINGWLFPDGDAQALAAKVLAVLAQRKKLPQIGRAARRSAEERADWKKNFRVLLEAYERTVQLISDPRRSK
jgi:glycosyltransferase involved in cell wall biosynthesis